MDLSRKSSYVDGGSLRGEVIQRPRSNQPKGYTPKEHGGKEATRHYCQKHNYVYYPQGWTSKSGETYKRGYYDEDGQYYPDVVFKQNGRYTNMMCVCDYCGSRVTRDLTDQTTLQCPQCGGNLRIESTLDEYTQDPLYTEVMDEGGKPFKKIATREKHSDARET